MLGDWFEQLTGFTEDDYEQTRSRLRVEGGELVSLANGARYRTGLLETPSLAELREQAGPFLSGGGATGLHEITGDVKQLHAMSEHESALFQVASQFNLLEMTSPDVTPEHGVTRYAWDRTQGPACAIAAGAGTIYRNYFARVDDRVGQTAERQIDCLGDLGGALAQAVGRPVSALYEMRNGYVMAVRDGLRLIEEYLESIDESQRDRLRGMLRIGVHSDIEVTHGTSRPFPLVAQTLCSALPIAYNSYPPEEWRRFAQLVLDALYEATLLAGVVNLQRGGSRRILLTRVGGGAFGNPLPWIASAIDRAREVARDAGLELILVSC